MTEQEKRDKMVKIVNKYNGTVGYDIPELSVHRNFYPKESKNVSFFELERLSFIPGGESILTNYLEITDESVVMELFNRKSEPEYHYSEEDVKKLLISGSLDQFLDCLDFGPDVVKDMIKDLSVKLPLNDMEKRQAIKDKLKFDVTRAIEIKNTKYDGDAENGTNASEPTERKRRTATAAPTGRRYQPSK